MSNSVDPQTGTITYEGHPQITKGDHSHMPSRTDAYERQDERGHINASSLGGDNTTSNVVPQDKDVNHIGYREMEIGETSVLQSGGDIHSEKTAFVSGQAGQRRDAFMVNDEITTADGKTDTVHLSFTNLSYAEQEDMEETAARVGYPDMPDPGDALRESMSSQEYAQLMEATDREMPSIAEEYDTTQAMWMDLSQPSGEDMDLSPQEDTTEAMWADLGEAATEEDYGGITDAMDGQGEETGPGGQSDDPGGHGR